jgi:hypothetical protein
MDRTLKQNSSFRVHTKCPYGVMYEDVKKVIDLLELKREFHHCCKSRIKGLKLDLVVAQNKRLGMKYNMENRRRIVEEAKTDLTKVNQALLKAQEQYGDVKDAVNDLKFIVP